MIMGELDISLQQYVVDNIVPIYNHFDLSHNVSHVLEVIDDCLKLGRLNHVNLNMIFTIAVYHDVGMLKNRENHEKHSKGFLLSDKKLKNWFTDEQLRVMAEASEDHRASSNKRPRTIYGLIVSDSDRSVNLDVIMIKTYNFLIHNFPKDDFKAHFEKPIHG